MTVCLGIETSGRGGVVSVASADGEGAARILASRVHAGTNAEALFDLFDGVLRSAGQERSDLDRVAVIQGPGSFTGLRVGIMIAKALAFGLNIELWAAPTLELLRDEAEAELAVVGAGRGFVFALVNADAPRRISATELSSLGSGPIALSTRDEVATAVLREAAREGLEVDLGAGLARRAAAGLSPTRRHEPALLTPLYLAPSQAERVHGLDLSRQVHTPAPPESWQEWSK